MVTPEERITRLEAVQEAIIQRFSDVISRQEALLLANESLRRDLMQAIDIARQEAREANEALRRDLMQAIDIARQEAREANEAARREAREDNDAARREAREDNDAARREAREDNEAARKEARENNEAARKEARNLLIAGFSIGAALFAGFGAATITLLIRVLERVPA